MLQTIIDVGATLVVIAGILGAFWAGFTGRKSTNTTDANETIGLINAAKKALEDKINSQDVIIADQDKRLGEQEKRIAELELINASYVKLFQGNPSQLEAYMRDTAVAMREMANTQAAILDKISTHAPATNVTINK